MIPRLNNRCLCMYINIDRMLINATYHEKGDLAVNIVTKDIINKTYDRKLKTRVRFKTGLVYTGKGVIIVMEYSCQEYNEADWASLSFMLRGPLTLLRRAFLVKPEYPITYND